MRTPRFLRILCLALFLASGMEGGFVLPQERLRVGLALPLTGPAGGYGTAYRRGIELAASDLPDSARRLEIVFEDHRYDMKSAVSSARKLAAADKVHLLAAWGYAPSDTLAPLSRELTLPLLLNSVNPVARGRPTVFNLSPPSRSKLIPLVEHLKKTNAARVVIVGSQVGTLEQWINELQDLLPAEIRVVGKHSLLADTMDFGALVSRVKLERPDAIVLFLLAGQARAFILRARELQLNAPIVGTDTLNDELVTQLFRDRDDGPVFVDFYLDPAFLARLKESRLPLSHVTEIAQGYLFFTLLSHLAAAVPAPFTSQALLEAMHGFPHGEGPAGPYETVFSADFGWHLSTPSRLNRIVRGEVVPLP
jgi:ABC-type branched-subunit amino acid transport system substrate-binding protein